MPEFTITTIPRNLPPIIVSLDAEIYIQVQNNLLILYIQVQYSYLYHSSVCCNETSQEFINSLSLSLSLYIYIYIYLLCVYIYNIIEHF